MKKFAALLLIGMLSVLPLFAITYGAPDGTRHPNVGALIAEWTAPGAKSVICSGTLIAPKVFLTAAHCTSYLEQLGITQVWVSFDSSLLVNVQLYSGTMHTNPAYNHSQSDPGDIAVITLDEAPAGITPASLPSAGYFDRLKSDGTLKDLQFTPVGYGVHQPNGSLSGGAPVFSGGYDSRWFSVSSFNALNGAWLRLSQNARHSDGGTCYGDSGGPDFIGSDANETSIIGAITVGGDAMCVATNVDYRLDTDSARNFLKDYVLLP